MTEVPAIRITNCTFYTFKKSGKYYTCDRGVFPEKNFLLNNRDAWRNILDENDGKWPGLATNGTGYYRIAIPDNDGVPRLFDISLT